MILNFLGWWLFLYSFCLALSQIQTQVQYYLPAPQRPKKIKDGLSRYMSYKIMLPHWISKDKLINCIFVCTSGEVQQEQVKTPRDGVVLYVSVLPDHFRSLWLFHLSLLLVKCLNASVGAGLANTSCLYVYSSCILPLLSVLCILQGIIWRSFVYWKLFLTCSGYL